MLSTNDELGIVLFKMLVAGLSLAITLPALFNGSYHVFMLTTFVFLLGKLVDSLDSFLRTRRNEMCIIYAIGCVLGVFSLMFCLYYLGAVFEGTLIDGAKVDLIKYPLLNSNFLWLFPSLVSAYYILSDLYHLGCVLYKYYATKKQIIRCQNTDGIVVTKF